MTDPPRALPSSTYRVQLSRRFGFRDALTIVPYLARLGISHLYLSPILAARAGSPHGYDVIDPRRLNPELGTAAEFEALVRALHAEGMGVLVDIVPNHMAAVPENPWWWDVLANGPGSPYARYFDIDWTADAGPAGPRVVLPILATGYRAALERGDITIAHDGRGFVLQYAGRTLPLRAGSQDMIRDPDAMDTDRLDALLGAQHYRLRFWRNGIAALNYRRFFDISDLVGMRVEDPDVFEATHALLIRLADDGLVDGLRVDHIDGLWDPQRYLQRLAARCPGVHLVVEKVLSGDETLPGNWPVAGTTGYDFARAAADVFIDPGGVRDLAAAYAALTGSHASFDEVAVTCRARVVRDLFPAEFQRLSDILAAALAADLHEPVRLAAALLELTAHLDVYRTYVTDRGLTAADRDAIDRAAQHAIAAREDLAGDIERVRRVLRAEDPTAGVELAMRWQQLTGAIMAKGVEDTALYADNRFLAANDVGLDPTGGTGVPGFHRRNLQIQARWPWTLNASSTHDSKRSEDVRARLSVLSEIPFRWARELDRWRQAAAPLKPLVRGTPVPGPNMELHLFQTLLGAWPLDADARPSFTERITGYVVKAAREMKLRTSWLASDEHYERALALFVRRLLDPQTGSAFLEAFLPFAREIAHFGMLNALAQLVLKIASPGVPDFYQGTELWSLTLVDPDNRRRVDFPHHDALLDEMLPDIAHPDPEAVAEFLPAWPDGRIKMYVMACGLRLRRQYRDVFAGGEYLPLEATGPRADHICAFARRFGQTWIIAASPRMMTALCRPPGLPTGSGLWTGTELVLPDGAPRRWRGALTGLEVTGAGALPAAAVFSHVPGALLVGGPS